MKNLRVKPVFIVTLFFCAGALILEAWYYSFPNVRLFDLDGEYNIPSLFEALLFGFAGLAALANCRRRSTYFWQWLFIGTALIFAGLDEFFCFHERVTSLASQAQHGAKLHNVWMLGYVPVLYGAIIFLKGMWREIKAVQARSAWLMVLALFCWFCSFPPELLVQWGILPERFWRFEIGFEELLEMSGSILLFYAFLSVPRSLSHRQPR